MIAPPIVKRGLLFSQASNPMPARRRIIVGKAIRKEMLPAKRMK